MNVLRRSVVALLLGSIGLFLIGCGTPTHILRQRGVAAYRMENYPVARTNFTQVHERAPQDWTANYYLGKLALADGDADAARTYLEVAYELRHEGPPLQPETPHIVDALAEAIYQQNDHPRLLGFCNEAITNYGTLHDYLRKATFLERIGDHDQALVAYRTAGRISEWQDASVFVALGDFYDALGDTDKAVVHLKKAYALDPDDAAIAERLRSHGIVPGPTIALPAGEDGP